MRLREVKVRMRVRVKSPPKGADGDWWCLPLDDMATVVRLGAGVMPVLVEFDRWSGGHSGGLQSFSNRRWRCKAEWLRKVRP